MNVPAITSGRDPTVARPPDTADPAARAPDAVASESISFTRVAWFDANGDGVIDNRSATNGGDGTLLLPAHAIDLPRFSRNVAAAHGAQAQQAIDAYTRYGQRPAHTDEPPTPATRAD